MTRSRFCTAAVIALAGLAAPLALAGGEACRLAMERERAGPPLICHPITIGDARSLPFGKDAFDGDKSYNQARVVSDTLAILKTERSTLVRMETLRRATVYIQKDRTQATELLAKLAWKAMDSDAADKPDAAAWFDAAYLAGCYSQLGVDMDAKPGAADNIVGYAWMQRALELSKHEPDMEFAAALMTVPGMNKGSEKAYNAHIRHAALGAPKGSLLEVNLGAHLSISGSSLEKVRAEARAGASNSATEVAAKEKKPADDKGPK